MKEDLRKKFRTMLIEGADQEEIDKVSRELLEDQTPLERAEVNQILEEVKAKILADSPPPKTMYV
jgi:hypothetical protein